MNEDFAGLVSPVDGSELTHTSESLLGVGGPFAIRGDIPRFVGADTYAAAFGIQWNEFAKTQLDSYTGQPISENRLKRCLNGELERIAGLNILEAGSGAGRFTEILLKHGANLHSFDYSIAVDANARNNAPNSRLLLVQADVRKMPFRTANYDGVVCLGVVQHTPNPEETIDALWRMVKPGGFLAFDHYVRKLSSVTIAEPYYRFFIKRLPIRFQRNVIDKITEFFFPIHWHFKDSIFSQRVLRRISPVSFYYPHLPLRDRQMYLEWAKLDTHDATTDHYKHHRTVGEIKSHLERLGATDIHVVEERRQGNGVEAFCRRAVAAQ